MSIEELKAENARLKAEVERLSKKEDYHHDLLNQYALDDMRLTAQVERLIKAGDFMANRLMYQGYHLTIPQWNEAKDLHPRA